MLHYLGLLVHMFLERWWTAPAVPGLLAAYPTWRLRARIPPWTIARLVAPPVAFLAIVVFGLIVVWLFLGWETRTVYEVCLHNLRSVYIPHSRYSFLSVSPEGIKRCSRAVSFCSYMATLIAPFGIADARRKRKARKLRKRLALEAARNARTPVR